ncbi:MAG: Crp/Fnr family transcriptional regulator [Chloroflexi bacterium]|nr:Crp/Fnr family transcriptional regulator [Ardenticatenaceae bacterium]NOG35812.1 Crp/Fnr family transcriptional regulator [Chloroflexota bacterium]GIK57908.1 MAG: CarD family transcriptional regulator [Chloroflexota bacterium]
MQGFVLAQIIQQISHIPLFAGLDAASLQELAQASRWREYETGEVVVLEGEAHPSLYYLQYGWLKVVKVSPNGREQILRFLEPGDTFNEIGVFANQPNPATAIALEPAGVWLIPRAALLRLLQEHPDFGQHIITNMAERMLYLVSLVTDLSLRPVTGRLARLLLQDAVGDALERPCWYTQAELAARLGTVPDVMQRALRTLESDGLIAVDRQQIRILDRPTLAEIAL